VTGEVWLEVPKTIRINLTGKIKNRAFFAKDAMLEVIHQLGVDGATNSVIEFGGEVRDTRESRKDFGLAITLAIVLFI